MLKENFRSDQQSDNKDNNNKKHGICKNGNIKIPTREKNIKL